MLKRTHRKSKFGAALARRLKGLEWWEITFAAIGIVALIGVLVILFLPFGKGPSQYRANLALPPAGSAPFLSAVSDQMAAPLDSGPAPEIIIDGDAYLHRLLDDIDAAQSSICMMNYIWSDGRFSDQVLGHLQRKAAAGVKVYILLDAYGSNKAPDRKFDALKKAGGEVAEFRSLVPLPWTLMRDTRRNHRRAITMDGRIGYTGGVAVDDKWLGRSRNPDEWHDLMFRFTGSMAARLMGSFSEVWMATTGQMLLAPAMMQRDPARDGVPYVTLSTSPSPDLFEAESFFLMSLWAAQRSIHVENPYFLPDAAIRKGLMDKARAGMDVVLLLPGEHTDERSVRWAGQRIYGELMDAGVKIYEFQPTFTHTKLMVEDGQWSVIGSANWDNRSRKLNDEILVGMSDPAFAAGLEAVFQNDLRRARRITPEEWRRRGPLQRVLEYLCQAFVQQY
jgi:cardiolipin synthase